VVTPEAVVLQLPRAGPGSRILARGLDLIIQSALILLFLIAAAVLLRGSGQSTGIIVLSVVLPLVIFGYPAILEGFWRGRTYGKAAFHLRVLTTDGEPIRFRHAAIRSFLWVVDGLMLGPLIGVLALVLTRDTVRLGDLAAGTMVVTEGTGASMPSAVAFWPPPGYEGYVATLDVSGLASADYELVRRYLLRAWELTPQARDHLATEVARPVAAKVRQGVPPGWHPGLFLECVAAAYQLRNGVVARTAVPSGWWLPYNHRG
jgi:uncharacterized RDD family membrane protein YckC